jgi:hypothetical protein
MDGLHNIACRLDADDAAENGGVRQFAAFTNSLNLP